MLNAECRVMEGQEETIRVVVDSWSVVDDVLRKQPKTKKRKKQQWIIT